MKKTQKIKIYLHSLENQDLMRVLIFIENIIQIIDLIILIIIYHKIFLQSIHIFINVNIFFLLLIFFMNKN